jgi:methionyl-tRNA formyltransferase
MKIVLFADSTVGLDIARYLLSYYPQDISIIFTVGENKISELACEKNIQTCIYDSMENVILKIPEDVELGVLAWWPKIIRRPLLEKFRQGVVNTHPSWLPYNRGKHYNFWALVEGAPFGVTLHRVDSGVDTGPIVAQRGIPYDWSDNGETLYKKAQAAMVELFCDVYPKLREGEIQSVPQMLNDGSSHHSSELELASRVDLDKAYPARDLLNLLRARTFDGHPGCWFEDGGTRYEISINIKKV